jgi:hypothetical protein
MSAAIVTCYTNNIAELVAPLSANKQEYCDRHGYKFFLCQYEEPCSGFDRIRYIRRLMYDNPEIDTFMWMDNDAFVMNMMTPIEEITNIVNNEFDLLIGADWNGINTGVFLIKNTKRCQEFLCQVLDFKPNIQDGRPYWWCISEQCAINDLMHTIDTVVCHHSLFNGYLIGPDESNDWRSRGLGNKYWYDQRFRIGDFVLHLVGTTLENRKIQTEEYLSMVIK